MRQMRRSHLLIAMQQGVVEKARIRSSLHLQAKLSCHTITATTMGRGVEGHIHILFNTIQGQIAMATRLSLVQAIEHLMPCLRDQTPSHQLDTHGQNFAQLIAKLSILSPGLIIGTVPQLITDDMIAPVTLLVNLLETDGKCHQDVFLVLDLAVPSGTQHGAAEIVTHASILTSGR